MKGTTHNKRNKRNKRNTRNTRKTRRAPKYGGYAYVTPKYSADVVTPSGTKHKKGDKKKKK